MAFRTTRPPLVALLLAVLPLACSHATIRSTSTRPLTASQMAEFFVDSPIETRDLFEGPGDVAEAPPSNSTFLLVKDDTTGWSPKYVVKDERGREWGVKMGPEAQPELVSSRLVWALGYQQLPAYLVGKWNLTGDKEREGGYPAARFRPNNNGYKNLGDWSWHENPFVGTQPYKGLLALMIMLNNSDLKPVQNHIYEVTGRSEMPQRIYVVQDLGLSWGESGILDPVRGNVEAFERQGFIKRVDGDHIEFDQKNLRSELFDQLTPADLRWIAARMSRLSEKQWLDAFRAGGYEEPLARRFIARMKQKIDQAMNAQADTTR